MKLKDFAFIIFVVTILFGVLIYFQINDYQKEKEHEALVKATGDDYRNKPTPITEYNTDFESVKAASCYYNTLIISTQVNDGEMDKQTINGCFKLERLEMGLVEITESSKNIKISYYTNDTSILNTKLGGETVEWRKRKGHDIYIMDKGKTLTIIFGDRHSAVGSVKSSLKFE